MTTFAEAVLGQETRTQNGMKTFQSSLNKCVDFFFKSGAMRGQDPIAEFTAAYVEDKETSLRILQWLRDVRGGAGERKLFRDILLHLESTDIDSTKLVAKKVGEVGRFDDLLIFKTQEMKNFAYSIIRAELQTGNSLCAKWMPRKGNVAAELRQFLGMTPKQYRKTLVNLTNVVESQMCANDWDNINFSHVPSKAHTIYKKAFERHTPEYKKYVQKLVDGSDPEVKVNAAAVFPYEVIKDIYQTYAEKPSEAQLNLITKQWESLPNYVGDSSVLAMVDVSGSMDCPAGKNTSITCLQVALSLGLYTADKNSGPFKDTFLTFSSKPELMNLRGTIVQKIHQMNCSNWSMDTNVIAAFKKILKVAVEGEVPQSEMPKTLLILSDMQFNMCAEFDDSAFESVKRQYEASGYEVPNIVFWNLNNSDGVPVRFDERGTALVSGFSPSILKSVLGNVENMSPVSIMLETINIPRYDLN